MARLLAEQPYVKIVRHVDAIAQTNKEEARTMYLYEDRLVTKYHEFPIHTVRDLSYRPVGKMGGLLYVHTDNGVFSYLVKSSPEHFVRIFKNYRDG